MTLRLAKLNLNNSLQFRTNWLLGSLCESISMPNDVLAITSIEYAPQ